MDGERGIDVVRNLTAEIESRLIAGIQKFQPILSKARAANKNESDTVTIITDILCEVFGFDKYENITSELPIKRSFCDLAVKLDGQLRLLIECKAIGVSLREEHVFQAASYAANAGTDWVVLTNGVDWRVYRVVFSKPMETVLAVEFDFCELKTDSANIKNLFALCREAFQPGGNAELDRMYSPNGGFTKYIVGQLMLNDWMIDTIRNSWMRHFPSVRITSAELRRMIHDEVFREEIVEGDSAEAAAATVAKANARMKEEQKARRK